MKKKSSKKSSPLASPTIQKHNILNLTIKVRSTETGHRIGQQPKTQRKDLKLQWIRPSRWTAQL